MNRYSQLTNEEQENHFSSFFIDSWSYSRVAQFARNEKEFERTAIYREESRRSASSVAGSAYHKALECYFTAMEKGAEPLALPELEKIACVVYETVTDEVCEHTRKAGVSLAEPTAVSDTVCYVCEFFGCVAVVVVEYAILENLAVKCGNTVYAVACNNAEVSHTDSAV